MRVNYIIINLEKLIKLLSLLLLLLYTQESSWAN